MITNGTETVQISLPLKCLAQLAYIYSAVIDNHISEAFKKKNIRSFKSFMSFFGFWSIFYVLCICLWNKTIYY